MTKENRDLLINAVAGLLLSFLIIVAFLVFIPTSVGDKLVGTKVKYEAVEVKDMPSSIVSVDKLNKGKNEVGRLYQAKKTNGYGSIELFVALDDKGTIIGIDAEVDQSIDKVGTKLYAKQFKGSNISNPKVLDGVTAPTVSISLGTVDELLADIALASGFVVIPEDTIYDILFGKDHTLKVVEFEALKSIKAQRHVEVNKEFVGFVFTAELEGEYNEGDRGIIKVDYIVNPENELIGYDLVEYGHTGGGFKNRVIAYLDSLVESKVNVLEIENHIKEVTGSTNSGEVINETLRDLSEAVESNTVVNIYKELFGNDVYLEQQNITQTVNVKKHFIIKNDDAIKGHSFEITGTGDFGDITYEIITNETFNIVKIVEIDYGHSPTHQHHVTAVMAELVKTNILVSEAAAAIPESTGATGTTTLVGEMFADLATFIEQGLSIYYDLFAENHKRENLNITEYKAVKAEETIKVDNILVGYGFIVEDKGIYRGAEGEEHQIIKLNLILDKEYKLIGYEILEYKHSSGKWKNNIIAYLDELVTAKADIVKIEDHLHDVTGSTNSGNLVNSMFRDLSEFINRELDLYYQLFGAGYEKEAFVADEFKSLLGKQNVKANEKGKTDGYVYTLELDGLYKGTDSGIIKINFILDVNHVLIGYEFVEYTHSGKNFQARIVTYLDSLVLEKADIVLIENYISDVTGSTNSGKLINEMLRDLSEYVINELDVYYQLFGAGYVKENVVIETTSSLKTKQAVKVGDVVKGHAYTLEMTSVYNNNKPEDEGTIKISYILDLENKLIGYEFVEYTHSGRNFQARIVTYLDSLVSVSANVLQIEDHIETVTNSTNSGNLVNEMLRDLSDFLNEGSK